MKRIRHKQMARQTCRRIAATLFVFAAVLSPFVARAEKANVFFIHGANVSEQDGRAWAAEMFKRLWQAGANMEFHPIGWESDIGPSYNYQVNVSNAFVTALRLAPYVNSIPGRRVVIAHSLGTMVATAASGRAAELHVRDVRKAHGALALGWKLHALDLFEGVRTRNPTAAARSAVASTSFGCASKALNKRFIVALR